jgi:hypothetical protein
MPHQDLTPPLPTAHLGRNPSQADPVFPQDLDFHVHLVRDHRRLKSADLLATRCIKFQSLRCIKLHPLVTPLISHLTSAANHDHFKQKPAIDHPYH